MAMTTPPLSPPFKPLSISSSPPYLTRTPRRLTPAVASSPTREPVGKGPIIVSVDESGSMEGEKAHTAKALALALAWIARRQRRWCGLVAYSGDSGERLLALPPDRWNETALMDW